MIAAAAPSPSPYVWAVRWRVWGSPGGPRYSEAYERFEDAVAEMRRLQPPDGQHAAVSCKKIVDKIAESGD